MENKVFIHFNNPRIPVGWSKGVIVSNQLGKLLWLKFTNVVWYSEDDLKRFTVETLDNLHSSFGYFQDVKFTVELKEQKFKITVKIISYKKINYLKNELLNVLKVIFNNKFSGSYLFDAKIITPNKSPIYKKNKNLPSKRSKLPLAKAKQPKMVRSQYPEINFYSNNWKQDLRNLASSAQKNKTGFGIPAVPIHIRRYIHKIIADYDNLTSRSVNKADIVGKKKIIVRYKSKNKS